MVNGRIQGIEDYLARVRPPCDACSVDGVAFDQRTGALLVASRRGAALVRLSVVGADGLLADLSCPDDYACRGVRRGSETLGPGADELTVRRHHEVQVIGFDGALRRTIDLSSVLDGSSQLGDLAWSPDGSRLAVTTRDLSSGQSSHLWLVNARGGDPQLVHTAAYTGPLSGAPLGYIWSLEWSPDGHRLGFIEEQARLANMSEESLSLQAVALLLPGPGQQGPGTPRTLYDYGARPFDDAAFLWSPDGTRAAVRDRDQVIEVSAEDGTVLARHSYGCTMRTGPCSPLIWTAKQP
jgi:hypothetical protein